MAAGLRVGLVVPNKNTTEERELPAWLPDEARSILADQRLHGF